MLPSKSALIEKVAEEVRQRVADGTYSYRIPGAPALGKELGVSRDEAWRAVRILRREGLLVTARQRTYVKTAYEAQSRGPATQMAPISADDLRKAIGQPDARFMTPEEFAKFTRLSKMTVYRLIHDRELGANKMGEKCFRIPIDSAVEFLKESGSL